MSSPDIGGNVVPYDVSAAAGANLGQTQPPMIDDEIVRSALRLVGVYEICTDGLSSGQPDLVDGIPANWKVSAAHLDVVRAVVARKVTERQPSVPVKPGDTMRIDVPETFVFADILVTLDRVPSIHEVDIGDGARAVVVPIGLRNVLRALMSGGHIDAAATRLVADAITDGSITITPEPEA